MSSWINIDRLGLKGIEPDLMPVHRDPNSLDSATNVRAVGPNLANAGGYLVVPGGTLPHSAHTIYLGKTFAERRLYTCSQSSVYEFDGTSWTDITGTAVDDGSDFRWTGGWLTGALTMANRLVVRTFKPGIDATTQPMVYNGGTEGPGDETWESKNYHAKVFRPFRNFMMAGNLSWDGVDYPSRIQWSHPPEPGQVPDDWVPLAENDAGNTDLADTPGAVVDMAPLRDYLMIYKRDAIHICEYIGGNEVFAFRMLTPSKGIHTTDCIVEYNGYHWCQGIEDIFLFDGNSVDSLIWGRLKKSWLADRDPDKAEFGFTTLDEVNQEILFCYVSKNAPAGYTYPDKCLVLSIPNKAFFYREYGFELPYAKVTLDVVNQSSANLAFYGLDRTGARLLDLEAAADRDGATVPAEIRRTGLFSDPGTDFIQVDRTKVQLTGQVAQLTLGDQIAVDAPVVYRAEFVIDPSADYKTDARANGNMIAYKIDLDTSTEWQVSNITMLVQKSGERG